VATLGLAVFLAGVAGCSKQSEDVWAAKSGAAGCDTAGGRYRARVVPISRAWLCVLELMQEHF